MTVPEKHVSFLRVLVDPSDVAWAVAWRGQSAAEAAAFMGVSVRTIQRWVAREKEAGHRCDHDCGCPVMIRSVERRCRFCASGCAGETVVGFLYGDESEYLEVPTWLVT